MNPKKRQTVTAMMLPVAELRPNPLNPRGEIDPASVDELAESIARQGVLEPIVVLADGTIVAGHRRHAAAVRAGLDEVPVTVHEMTEDEQLEAMVVENVQREDLTPLQEARAYERMLASGATQADIARRIGLAPARVGARLALLEMDETVARMIDRGELPVGAIAPLAKASAPEQRRLAGMLARRQVRLDDLKAAKRGGGRGRLSEIKRNVKAVEKEVTPREEAVGLVREHSKRIVSFRAIADVLEMTCCECGLKGSPDLCLQCPLPKFVKAIVRESANVRRPA